MKQKITLSVDKEAKKIARRYSRSRKKSISELFEEFIKSREKNTPAQQAAERLLCRKPVKRKAADDKEVYHKRLVKKYA